jgi:hypothetical protein
VTEIVDVTSTPDQMRILDTLNIAGAKVSVIEVRAGHLSTTLRALRDISTTLRALRDIGFLDAVTEGQFTCWRRNSRAKPEQRSLPTPPLSAPTNMTAGFIDLCPPDARHAWPS